jgi:hypothetical protein
MRQDHFERLEPFLYRKSARQRIILYLFARGLSVADMASMTPAALRELRLPDSLDIYREEMLNEQPKAKYAFVYPNGNHIPPSAYYRILRESTEKVLGRPLSLDTFKTYISTGHK